MRGTMGTLVIFLICLVVVVIYIFLGKGQISLAAANLDVQIAVKDSELTAIHQKRNQIPALKASLPIWREQLEIFTTAIPVKVDDHIFFGNLIEQLDQHPDVNLLSLDSLFGGPWLGQVEKEQEEVLVSYGIDVESAKSIRVSFFTLKLMGDFDEVLKVIENLKKYRRLYTIDMIAGPATGGSGSVTQSAQPEVTPIQITGRLYFNLPETKVDISEVTRMYLEVFAGMLQNDLVDAGKLASGGDVPTLPPPSSTNAPEDGEPGSQGETEDGGDSEELDEGSDDGDTQQTDDNSGDLAIASFSGSAGPGV